MLTKVDSSLIPNPVKSVRSVVHAISPKEKGETITMVACLNVVGSYLPPRMILKGMRTIVGLKERLPGGSEIHIAKWGYFVSSKSLLNIFKSARTVQLF